MPKQSNKIRFSVGRRVLVGIGLQPATVQSVAGAPSVMGEFVHEVLVDGKQQAQKVLGCSLKPLPDLDEDLRNTGSAINIQHSNISNVNLGSQVGTINATLQSIYVGDGQQKEFTRALEQLTQAVVSETRLQDGDKQEIMDALLSIAEQAAKKPEARSNGMLKAAVSWLPTAVSTVKSLSDLWDTLSPVVKSHLGIP